MRSRCRGSIFILSLLICFVFQSSNSFGATWEYRNDNWYCTDTGWVLCDSGWYYVDNDNKMLSNAYIDGYYLSYTGRMVNESDAERSVNRFIQSILTEEKSKFEVDVTGKSFVKAASGKNIFGSLSTATEDGVTYGWYADTLYHKMRTDTEYIRTTLEPYIIRMLGKTEQDIISEAHDIVCTKLEYGLETNAAFALKTGQGACGTYAIVFKYLLNACGIDCDYVTGYTSEGSHAWNRVHTSDGTFLVDVCWDDISLSRDWYMKEVLPNHIEVNR